MCFRACLPVSPFKKYFDDWTIQRKFTRAISGIENFMQLVSLPKQLFPNRPSEHWHCPLFPQVPWPLHVVLGLQNSRTNEKKVSKSTFKSENNENLITY